MFKAIHCTPIVVNLKFIISWHMYTVSNAYDIYNGANPLLWSNTFSRDMWTLFHCECLYSFLTVQMSSNYLVFSPVCNYTGLEEDAVKHLHRWCVSKNNGADLSMIDNVYIGDEEEQEYWRRYEKQSGIPNI